MKSISVHVGEGYTVSIGTGMLACMGELLQEAAIEPCRVAIVSDDKVGPLFTAVVERSLAQAGFSASIFCFPAGEQFKNMQTLTDILEFLAAEQLTRTDFVVALGGGVVGDLAGFAAGCYLRGIRYVQIPTTLLAMVDSSVGGKTGLDLSAGKNLAGLFWQPSAVVCDIDCLGTLPDETFLDGLVEAIKTGILGDEELFSLIESGDFEDNLEDIIARSVAFKAHIVEADERESGLRKSLNLGHTIGHAIEACSGYTVSHGNAVSSGLALITRVAVALGYCSAEDAHRIVLLLIKLGLPADTAYTTEELVQAALHDKKRAGKRITLVLPERIGSYLLHEIDINELAETIDKGRNIKKKR